MKVESVCAHHYRIPLATTLTDSTHGEMTHFELITVQLRCDGGEEGLGYTYTVGRGGSAVLALLNDDLIPFLIGADPEGIEELWEQMWWRVHYVGRGGLAAISPAISRARGSSSSGSSTSIRIPYSSASCACISLPVRVSSAARW